MVYLLRPRRIFRQGIEKSGNMFGFGFRVFARIEKQKI